VQGTWQEQLRARGYRLTPQRQLVLEAVTALGHATPEEIATKVRDTAAGVNISTVYRTLELLEQLGLVRHTHLGHGAPTYHPSDVPPHVHVICHACERVMEADPELVAGLAERLRAETGFVLDVHHVSLAGLCAACAQQEDAR
jgi:Fur family ferric uptake transcriptional regulator